MFQQDDINCKQLLGAKVVLHMFLVSVQPQQLPDVFMALS